jgi:hypothetical protein
MHKQLTLNDVAHPHPIALHVDDIPTERNRLTCAFRPILALPHLILVGGPVALALSFVIGPDWDQDLTWGAGGGVLGVAAMAAAMISWFAIVFTGRMPKGLWKLNTFYLHWRVRAAAYTAMLRDEYPPLGDGSYPFRLELPAYTASRDRVSVAFRIILVLPHLFMVWLLGVGWLLKSIVAWFSILLTGQYPRSLYDFAMGVLRWSTSVESYLLLLHDDYPPFRLAA